MKIIRRSALSAFVGLLLFTVGSFAAEPPAGGLLDKVWTIIPKKGSEVKFDKAFAEHVQWRRDHKDPWTWEVYVEVDGPETGAYFARSGNHNWSDFDAYDASDFSAQAGAHWNATMAPHVGEIRSSMSQYLPDISQWPNDAPEYQLFQLITYRIKQGQHRNFTSAAGALADALKEAKWPYHWAFMDHQSGQLPSVLLVLPSLKWADMAEPNPNVFQAVANVRGQEKAGQMFDAYSATLARTDAVVVRRLPTLAVTGAK